MVNIALCSGLSVVGRDNYGVFPLRGKLLNVREAGHDQILKNEELASIVQILVRRQHTPLLRCCQCSLIHTIISLPLRDYSMVESTRAPAGYAMAVSCL